MPCPCGAHTGDYWCAACVAAVRRARSLRADLERDGTHYPRDFESPVIKKILAAADKILGREAQPVSDSDQFGCLTRCGKPGRVRGLCPGCHGRLRKRVLRGELTWEQAQELGLILARKVRRWNSLPVFELGSDRRASEGDR